MIGCTILRDSFQTPQEGARFIGCTDINGTFDDHTPNAGTEPAAFKFTGSATTGYWYSKITGYGDDTFFESDFDTITSVQQYDTESGQAIRTIRPPEFFEFSFLKRYNGVFTQDGVTNDTILTLDNWETTPIWTAGLNLQMYLYQGSQWSTLFVTDYDNSNTIKILDSWTTLQPKLDVDGRLNNKTEVGTVYYLYFPYVRIAAGIESTIGTEWIVQTQRYKQNYTRLSSNVA